MNRIRVFLGLVAAILVATASLAQAANKEWNAGTAPWTTTADWITSSNSYGPYGTMAVDNNGNPTISTGQLATDALSGSGVHYGR